MLSLESLPAEIIDRLVPLLDLHSLFNLCHCLIYLKPLSKAIYDVSTTILMRNVWPRLELGPVYDNSCRPESYFDWFRSGDASLIQYTTILNRFGGALDLTLCCERHLHCYRQFLPRRFILTIQLSVTLPDQVEALLRILSLWKVDVEELSIFSDECQPDYDIEHLEKINLSAIQDMRVAKLNLFDVSPLLLEQVPQFKGVKTLQLDDADGFEHIAPIPSLECLIIENSDAKHQYNAQNAIIKGTHPNLKRVEVHYTMGNRAHSRYTVGCQEAMRGGAEVSGLGCAYAKGCQRVHFGSRLDAGIKEPFIVGRVLFFFFSLSCCQTV